MIIYVFEEWMLGNHAFHVGPEINQLQHFRFQFPLICIIQWIWISKVEVSNKPPGRPSKKIGVWWRLHKITHPKSGLKYGVLEEKWRLGEQNSIKFTWKPQLNLALDPTARYNIVQFSIVHTLSPSAGFKRILFSFPPWCNGRFWALRGMGLVMISWT